MYSDFLDVDPRITVGIPIIGCPDYMELMKYRANKSGVSLAAPHMPASLFKLIGSIDPASKEYTSTEAGNPFLGKKILVLSGEEDPLVPWVASKKFMDRLEVGAHGSKRVFLQKGVGHVCTEEMVQEASSFIETELLN